LSSTFSPTRERIQNSMTATILNVAADGGLEAAIRYMSSGSPIVVPTETIFGLTCDATNPAAIEAVYAIKGRPLAKSSAIFLPSVAAITRYAFIEHDTALMIIREFLPGPLTVILNCPRKEWPGVVSDEGKIGIRVSPDPFIRELAERLGKPLLATSANKSGASDCGTLDELTMQLGEAVPLILYRQKTAGLIPSTVLDLTEEQPKLVREGAIRFAKILETLESIDGK
jgi:L-threonylcarbamoyladenylate synthase